MIESIVTNHTPRAAVCSIGPTLDFRFAEEFRTQWEHLLQQGYRNFVLEFSRTGILDSAGLGAIFALHKRAGAMGGRVVVAAPSRPVQSVMALIRCEELFGNYPSVQAAINGLSEPPRPRAEPEPKVTEPAEAKTTGHEASAETVVSAGTAREEATDLPSPNVDTYETEPEKESAEPVIPAAPAAVSIPRRRFSAASSGDGLQAPASEEASAKTVRGAGSYRVTAYAAPVVPADEQHVPTRPSVEPQPPPALPSAEPQPPPALPSAEPRSLDHLLHLATAYGFIHSSSVAGAHVYLCLLEGSPAMEMGHASAEQFLKDLIGDLPEIE